MTQESRMPRRAIPGWLRGLALLALIALLIYTARQQPKPPPAEKPAASESQPREPETPQPGRQPETPLAPPTSGESTAPREADRPVRTSTEAREPAAAGATQTVIAGQTIRDQDGQIVHRGSVDVADTLSRIEAGERLRFPNDGATFQNRERRLPPQRAGYYREWVHPTPGLRGPGPQRIVTGQRGEIYYTPDHYRSFRRLDGG